MKCCPVIYITTSMHHHNLFRKQALSKGRTRPPCSKWCAGCTDTSVGPQRTCAPVGGPSLPPLSWQAFLYWLCFFSYTVEKDKIFLSFFIHVPICWLNDRTNERMNGYCCRPHCRPQFAPRILSTRKGPSWVHEGCLSHTRVSSFS